jgi:hypothetical protein
MDLLQISNKNLLQPLVQEVRRQDEFYVTVHCGVEVQEAWGKQVHGACHRACWYRSRGYHPDNTDSSESARKKYWGDAIEKAEIELYKRSGIFIDAQVGFWVPQYYLKGRIDCFVRDPDSWTGQDLVAKGTGRMGVVGVDIKSTWSFGSKGTIDCPAGVKPWPKWEHIIQCAIYHWHFRKVANYWQLVYIARDSGRGRVHNLLVLEDDRISVNGEILTFKMDDIWSRLKTLATDLHKGEAPARDFELVYDYSKLTKMADAGVLCKTDTEKVRKNNKLIKGDWQCQWCEFVRMCWQGVQLPYGTKVEDALE